MATGKTLPVNGVDAVFYPVKDLERATEFYNALLGMEPTQAWPNFGAEYTLPNGETFGFLKFPDVERFEPYRGAWRSGSGVMFAVDDIEAVVATCKARGVKFYNDGKIEDTPVCSMVFVEDSEGNSFILHKRK